ncbi:MAG: hypothetical protein K1X48_05135 [Burkholderiaceae bacterium]|nr:hypothetical protein [Burkholderiaceae bacterium]
MKQEIWIYIDCPIEKLLKWLSSVIGPLKEKEKIGDTCTFYNDSNNGVVLIMSNHENSCLEVGFYSPPNLWTTPVECGRQAARELKCKVRCEPGADYPEVHPLSDTFLEIDGTKEPLQERLFTWEEET